MPCYTSATGTTWTVAVGNYVFYSTTIARTTPTANVVSTWVTASTGCYLTMSGWEYEPAHQVQTPRDHPTEAQERARALLLKNLTPEQRHAFERNGWFVVEGGKSGRQYRIWDKGDLIANIDVLEGGRVSHRLCGHCEVRAVPLGDQLLAQKIMLECDEDAFLKLANRHAA